MAFTAGTYAEFTSLPSPEQSVLTSSRKIDFLTRKYVLTSVGGFEAMDDIGQRVVLLVSFAQGTRPPSIDERSLKETEYAIREALKPMIRGPEPEIRLLSVSTARVAAGVIQTTLVYKNLLTGTKTSVQL